MKGSEIRSRTAGRHVRLGLPPRVRMEQRGRTLGEAPPKIPRTPLIGSHAEHAILGSEWQISRLFSKKKRDPEICNALVAEAFVLRP